MPGMKSSFPSPSVDRSELEDLVDEVLQTYRAVAVAIGKLDGEQGQELNIEARDICRRLEAIMGLLEDESIETMLNQDELEDGVQALVAEAKSLEGRLKMLISKIQSQSR